MSNVLCTICARGGSKGVKNKNVKLLNGKPLIAYTIEQAKASQLFDHIVISTDSDQIADVATQYGAEVFFKRSAELSSDTAGKLGVIQDALLQSEAYYGKKYPYHVDLDATSPLRSVEDIVNSFQQLIENKNDNLITAMPSRRSPYFNLVELNSQGKVALSKQIDTTVVRRQDAPETFDMNASIYIWTREALLNNKTLFTDKTGLYVMPEERSIDIDAELDFEFVEFLMRKQNAKK